MYLNLMLNCKAMPEDFMEKFAKWIMVALISLMLLGIPVGAFCYLVPKYSNVVMLGWMWIIIGLLLFGLVVWTISILIDLINDKLD